MHWQWSRVYECAGERERETKSQMLAYRLIHGARNNFSVAVLVGFFSSTFIFIYFGQFRLRTMTI